MYIKYITIRLDAKDYAQGVTTEWNIDFANSVPPKGIKSAIIVSFCTQ